MIAAVPQLRLKTRVQAISFDRAMIISVATAFLVTRVLVGIVIFLSSATLPVRQGHFLFADPHNVIIDGLVRFDSWWYLDIARHGYRLGDVTTGQQGTVAFFPLYPMLIRILSHVVHDDYIAGLLISNISFLIALVFLYLWADREFEEGVAGRLVFYVAAAPAAVFFSTLYTESLFLALVCATFFFAGRRQWYLATIPAILASATRNTGIFLAVVIGLEGMRVAGVQLLPRSLKGVLGHYRRQLKPLIASWEALAAAACVPLGILAYMAYLSHAFGDPLAFIHAQATWGRSTSASGILNIVKNTSKTLRIGPEFWTGQVDAITVIDSALTLIFLGLVVASAFKLRPAYAVFAAVCFLAPISTGSVGSMTRYVLMLVPCFALLAIWGRRAWVDRVVLGTTLPLFAFLAIQFSHWYFAG